MLGSRYRCIPHRTYLIHNMLPSSLALSLHSVSVSFLVVFRNLIAVFVAAFEFFVQAALSPHCPHACLIAISHDVRCRDRASAWVDWAACWPCCRSMLLHAVIFPAQISATGCCPLCCGRCRRCCRKVKSRRPEGNLGDGGIDFAAVAGLLLGCSQLVRHVRIQHSLQAQAEEHGPAGKRPFLPVKSLLINKLKRLQPNVAAFLNNAYALPLFLLAAFSFEGSDLGVSAFAKKVPFKALKAIPLHIAHAPRSGSAAAVAGARPVLCRRALSQRRWSERSGASCTSLNDG
jgi:hypothetical protein